MKRKSMDRGIISARESICSTCPRKKIGGFGQAVASVQQGTVRAKQVAIPASGWRWVGLRVLQWFFAPNRAAVAR
jgi:hypothetical protein